MKWRVIVLRYVTAMLRYVNAMLLYVNAIVNRGRREKRGRRERERGEKLGGGIKNFWTY